MKELAKSVLRRVRHLPERILHPVRRRRALARLRAMRVRSAVFICHGNINRSAYAAAVFERALAAAGQDAVQVRSAGFIGPDRSASASAQKLALRRGIDLSDHRSRLIDTSEVRATDLIVVMDPSQRRRVARLTRRPEREIVILGDLDPERVTRRGVRDPYGHPEGVFLDVFDRIDRCVTQLVSAVRDARSSS